MSIFKRLEKTLDQKLRGAFESGEKASHDREMIEIHRAILDDVVSRVQPGVRGRKSFPFNQLTVKVSTPNEERQALYESMFGDREQFLGDVRGALAEAGVEPPADLDVSIQGDETELPGGYHVSFGRRAKDKVEAADDTSATTRVVAKPQKIALKVVQGDAEKADYEFQSQRLNLGRLGEVVDDQQRLIRRNDVVFKETDSGANGTVSRAHAHLARDAKSGDWRLFDDGSAYGTSVFRDGQLIEVPKGGSRGIALRSGDEIYLGQARIRFELTE